MSEEKRKSIRDAWTKFEKDPMKDGTDLLKCLNNYKDTWIAERQKQQDQGWKTKLAFYSGNHYIRDVGPAGGYRVRLRENHTNNIINRMLSIFVQNMPIVRVFPNSTDYNDEQDAKTTENFGKYQWRVKKLDQLFVKLPKYASIFGSAFTYNAWDADAGGKVLLDASETKEGVEKIQEYKGDNVIKVVDPFRVAVRPGIDEMEDQYDCIYSEPVNRYGLEAKHGKIDGESAVGVNAYTGSHREDDELIMLNHYYHKPTPWFPEGLYACWAGKKLIKVRPALECETTLPIGHLPFDKAPLSFYGMSSIDQVMDLQEQLNRAASMIVEARNLIARPRILASNEAKVPAQSITDRPGDVIRYALAGGKPEFVVPQFNFGEMAAHKSDVRNAISQVMGMTGASRGDIPQATRTALALQLVLEQDRSQFLPFIKNYHQVILDTISGMFQTAAEFISEEDPRSIKISSASGSVQGLFHGGMVPDPLDAYLEDTNPIGWTAAGRVEQIGHLIDRGVLKDRNQVLEMLSINSTDPAYASLNINKQAAQKEIVALNKGEMLEIGPEDDDGVHLDEHTKVVASYDFRSLPQPAKDAHLMHIEQHKQRVMAGQPQGQPPGGVKGSQPADPNAQAAMLQAPQPGQAMGELLTK